MTTPDFAFLALKAAAKTLILNRGCTRVAPLSVERFRAGKTACVKSVGRQVWVEFHIPLDEELWSQVRVEKSDAWARAMYSLPYADLTRAQARQVDQHIYGIRRVSVE